MATECSSKHPCDTTGIAPKAPLEVANKEDGSTAVSTTPSRKPINPNKVLKRKNTPVSLPTVRKLSEKGHFKNCETFEEEEEEEEEKEGENEAVGGAGSKEKE